MDIQTWLLYLAAVTGLSLTPGPNGLLSLTHGVIYGTRRTLFTVSGGIIGFALLMALSMAGLGALLATSEKLFTVVKWLGAMYLIYLGIHTWRAQPVAVTVDRSHIASHNESSWPLFTRGFLVAVSNPKVILFFTAFLPQFIDPAESQWLQFSVMLVTFSVIEFVVETILAGSAERLAPWLSRSGNMRIFNRISGGTFIAAGTFLAAMEK